MKLLSVVIDECTEEILDRHDATLKSLRDYHDTNRDVFAKVAEREELFRKFLASEVTSQ